MHRVVQTSVVAAALLAVTASSASAQSQSSADHRQDDPVQQQLRQMQEELNLLRRENQSMRSEIDDLRAKTDADWLTEQRANEIRGLVHDVLADADTRASLLNDGLAAGWSENFFLASPDGRFLLTLDGMLQIRWIYNYHDEPDRHRRGFENTRTRLTFRGHVFGPDVQYLVRGEFNRDQVPAPEGGGFELLDAWVRYNFTDNWSLRFGQFKLPFTRERLVSSATGLAVERSLVDETTNLGRSQGVELTYADATQRLAMALSDGATFGPGVRPIFGSIGVRMNSTALSVGNEWAVTGRYEYLWAGDWEQFADLTSPPGDEFGLLLGIAAHGQQSESLGTFTFGRDEIFMAGYTADLSAEWGGVNAFVSFTHLYIDSPSSLVGHLNIMGIVAQAGMYIAPRWEIFARYEWGQYDFRGGGTLRVPDLHVVTAGVNYYIDGHDLKWTTDLGVSIDALRISTPGNLGFVSDLAGYRSESGGAEPQIVFRTQFQLLF